MHALTCNGRASLSTIAEVLGSSEQTVARRYRRLREAGVIRVTVVPAADRLGQGWMVRMQIRPASVAAFADLIARRDDVSWVSITAGGTEVLCSMRPRSRDERDTVLLERLPRTTQITSLSPVAILHQFVTDTSEWAAFGDPLTPAQVSGLAPAGAPRALAKTRAPGPDLEPGDAGLVEVLRRDGRATYADLAARTAWTPGQVARRLDALLESGALYLDLEIANELIGFHVSAMLWITVRPNCLDAAGREFAEHAETTNVSAVSGVANLVVGVLCRDSDELYAYMTGRAGQVDGIQGMEVVPDLRRVKQAGSVMDGRRLPDPTAG